MIFNRRPLTFGRTIEQPRQELIRNTLGLVNASIEDALRYGGDITRAAIGAMDIRNDRKNIIVDVKVHMLMPGFYAAIPGWHTDGVPRGPDLNPLAKAPPEKWVQEEIEAGERPGLRPTHYHMIVTGLGCLTEFVKGPINMPTVDPRWRTAALYAAMDQQVEEAKPVTLAVPSCQAVEFDWWDIHRGVEAQIHEWRYFIRVAELDLAEPERDLRKVIRTQHQIYAPKHFGW